MDNVYNRLMQNLNAVKYDLIEMNNMQLALCIRRIDEAIVDIKRLDLELTKLRAIQEIRKRNVDLDVCDCWE